LEEIAERFSRVQIENQDAISVIERFDREDTLLYCDPPYPPGTRSWGEYEFEMTEEEHRELANVLQSCDAKVAISSYNCPLMRELYGEWHRVDAGEKRLASTAGASEERDAEESLWCNYIPEEVKE
jgi:DNA adenine methylase